MAEALEDKVIKMLSEKPVLEQEIESLSSKKSENCKVSIRLPPFWPDKPAVWFAQVEAQFEIAGIVADRTKYNYVVGQIDHKLAGLRRDFVWQFVVADVQRAIIGADFLAHYHLLPDCRNKKLIDNTTKLSSAAICTSVDQPSVKSIVVNDSNFAAVLAEFPDITRPPGLPREVKHDTVHFINTSEGPPVSCRPRRLAPHKLVSAKKEFEDMVRCGTARPSKSAWSSPLHMTLKKDNTWRPCGDYRALNARTIPDKYPVRHINDFAHNLTGATVFSTPDLVKAYHQIPVHENDISKTAIVTPFGLFEFPFMTFGLRNAGQTFQRFIDEVTRGLDFCFPYIDDILVYSKNESCHREHLRILFKRLQDYGVVINSSKCVIGAKEVQFLGYHISSNGTRPPKERIQALLDFKPPETVQGDENIVADAMSRVEAIALEQEYEELAKAQDTDDEVDKLMANSSLKIARVNISGTSLLCDISTGKTRPYVPLKMRPIDRASRWPEVWPMQGITAEEVAETLVREWISRFGVPATITTDQGTQFESDLFRRLLQTFATKRIRTTSYHPQANGIIERVHRQLKASIMCHNGEWLSALPLVLLGMRTVFKEDLKASVAEMLYGETLRVPGEILVPNPCSVNFEDPTDFVVKLRRHMSKIRPIPASRHTTPAAFVFKQLNSSSHVYLREDAVRRALQPPYNGPYLVIERSNDGKSLTLDIKGKKVTVSVDRVKPAFIESQSTSPAELPPTAPFKPVANVPKPKPLTAEKSKPAYTTRSGRTVRFKVFKD
ncbi:uncharacterized protein LOC142985941 [Anticarsia gemmatalis]|uniref:uncharacterized protein LOC142985941 n=1 Tax=Anticarsia gemmatalis TaxID=129554 RepID=UPI003F75AFAF